jgi:hypothetical protein
MTNAGHPPVSFHLLASKQMEPWLPSPAPVEASQRHPPQGGNSFIKSMGAGFSPNDDLAGYGQVTPLRVDKT